MYLSANITFPLSSIWVYCKELQCDCFFVFFFTWTVAVLLHIRKTMHFIKICVWNDMSRFVLVYKSVV